MNIEVNESSSASLPTKLDAPGKPHSRHKKRTRLLDVLSMAKEAASFFQEETRLETNPKVGFFWMRLNR
jgi:hypothetical protein